MGGKGGATAMESLPLLPTTTTADDKAHHHDPHPPAAARRRWLQGLAERVPPRLQGLGLVAASAFTFSILSAFIKYASFSMPSMETVFWRSFVAWLLNLLAVRHYCVSLVVPREFWPALATRCLVGSCAMSLFFYAMQQMVLADASVLVFTSPVMTFFLGALVLNERIDAINLACGLLSFVGVLCVSRPTWLFGDPTGTESDPAMPPPPSYGAIFCALLGALGQAVVYVSMRKLQGLHFMVVIHYFLLSATLFSATSLALVQRAFVLHLPLDVWLACLGSGFMGFLGQLFLTRGFQLEKAGTASVMRYLDIVFVFVWDLAFLHERINPWSVVGAMIICASAVGLAIHKLHQ